MFEVQCFLRCNSKSLSILTLRTILKVRWYLWSRCGLSSRVLKVSLQPATLSKKVLQHRCFVVNISKVFRMAIFKNTIDRSSRPEVFCEKVVLRNFTKFTGKHLWQSLFFNKVARLRPVTLLKKRLWHWCFPVNFVKFLRTRLFL